jgi:hypothetical protein
MSIAATPKAVQSTTASSLEAYKERVRAQWIRLIGPQHLQAFCHLNTTTSNPTTTTTLTTTASGDSFYYHHNNPCKVMTANDCHNDVSFVGIVMAMAHTWYPSLWELQYRRQAFIWNPRGGESIFLPRRMTSRESPRSVGGGRTGSPMRLGSAWGVTGSSNSSVYF